MANAPGYRSLYRWKQYAGIPTSLVDAGPVREHLLRLTSIGWSLRVLEQISGISDQGMCLILQEEDRQVERRTHERILAVPYTLAVPDSVDDHSFVPGQGAARRYQALMALGWGHKQLAPLLRKTNPAHITRKTTRMLAYRWREVDEVYQRLQMQLGPSTVTASRAVSYGYVPPLGWQDIDDPDETPRGGRRGRDWTGIDPVVVDRLVRLEDVPFSTRAEKVEAMRRWQARGGSERAMCNRYGWHAGRYTTTTEGQAAG